MSVQLDVDVIALESDAEEQVPEQDGGREGREVVRATVDEEDVRREEAARERNGCRCRGAIAIGNMGEDRGSGVEQMRGTARSSCSSARPLALGGCSAPDQSILWMRLTKRASSRDEGPRRAE